MKPLLVLLLALAVVPLGAARPTQSPAQLPDLGVAPPRHLLIGLTQQRQKKLFFTVSIANVGVGPIEVGASRAAPGAEWTTWQRVRRADGSAYRVPTPGARMVFVGHPEHGHWHIRQVARYELRRLGSSKPLRMRLKRGFCLYDSTDYRRSLPGAPRAKVYERLECGKKRDRSLLMGISVGWKDDYYWRIPGQAFDITSVPLGDYRLVVEADPRNWYRESNERNNVTWVDIRIGEKVVKVLRRSKPV